MNFALKCFSAIILGVSLFCGCSTTRAISPNSSDVGLAGVNARLKIHLRSGDVVEDNLLYDAPDSIYAIKKTYAKSEIQFVEIAEFSGKKTTAAVAGAAGGVAIVYAVVVIIAIFPALFIYAVISSSG